MDLRYFTLGGSVATDVGVSPADTLKTKTALRELGHFRTPAWGLTDFPDPPMIEGVKSFQRARGLKADGRMNPGGPTERAIDRDLARRRAARPDRGSGAGRAAASRAENLLALRRPTEFNAFPPSRAATETAGGSGRGSGGGRRQGVGLFQPNALADVIRAKRQLTSAGHLLGGRARVFDGRADEGLISAIGTFQLENGLKHDNFLLPGGETQRALDSRPRANPFAPLAIPFTGEADPAEPPLQDDTPRDEAPEREDPEREDPGRESPERDDPGADGPGADRDPREEQEAVAPAIPYLAALAVEFGMTVAAILAIYLSMSRQADGSSEDGKGHPDEPSAWRDEDEGWHVNETWPEAPSEEGRPGRAPGPL